MRVMRWFPALVIATLACAGGATPEPARRVLTNAGRHCWVPGRPGVLTGRVIDDSSGSPVPGIRLVASPGGSEAVTDSAGRYEIGPLCPASYTIGVESESHYQWSRPRIYVAADSQTVRDVHVASLLCTDVTPLAQLSGVVVRDSTGEPIEGAQVSVAGSMCGAITDRDGRFTIRVVPSGDQRVHVRRIGDAIIDRQMNIPAGKVTTLWLELRPAPTQFWVTPVPADSAHSP